MAQVVLENVYKSFPQRQGGKVAQPTQPPIGVGGTAADITSVKTAPPSTPEPTDNRTDGRAAVSVLRRINLTIPDGEFMVLVGPSGCGKSTLLRLIAGLEELTGGSIWVGDRLVNDLPPKQRDIAMVFQSYALYPHMTVYENLAFGLRRAGVGGREIGERERIGNRREGERGREEGERGRGKGERGKGERGRGQGCSGSPDDTQAPTSDSRPAWLDRLLVGATRSLPTGLRYWSEEERSIDQRVRVVAQMLQIEALLDRFPKQLSGGQKQRVALGRAMARNPQVFLMDEPLSNLDAKLRTETRAQIVGLQRKLGTTTIYVTHDQTEAMTMGDRIAVMNAGQIQQVARPLDLYNRPANRFVAEFIGSPPMNFLPIQIKAPLLIQHPQFRFTLPESWELNLRPYVGRSLTLGIRPEHLTVSLPAPKNLPVRVERVEALGSETYLTVSLTEATPQTAPLQVRIESDRPVSIGETLWLNIPIDRLLLFEPASGEAIGLR